MRIVMSEYVECELHESIDHVELRWNFENRRYGLVITPELFDLLCVDSGQDSPILAKIITNAAAWQNRGLIVGEDGFSLA
jgi:hypothetical protein